MDNPTPARASFPEDNVEATTILVVSNLQASVDWWAGTVGAELVRAYGGTSAVLRFAGMWMLLVTGGPPTPDKPDTVLEPPVDPRRVSHAMTVRVTDCQNVYQVLSTRGAVFLTAPLTNEYEVRCFTSDPDGHLLEFSQLR